MRMFRRLRTLGSKLCRSALYLLLTIGVGTGCGGGTGLPTAPVSGSPDQPTIALVTNGVVTGSGGDTGPSAAPVSGSPDQPTLATAKSLLAATPIRLPDLRATYDAMCGNRVHVQTMLAVNLSGHRDGRKDLLFNLICHTEPYGTVNDGPTPNRLVAFVQRPDGSFVEGTRTVFGRAVVDVGGAAYRAVAHDLNNDGFDDIVLSVSREDGRLPVYPDVGSMKSYNVLILSNGSGSYAVTPTGQYAWNYGITLLDNEHGGKDVYMGAFHASAQVWTNVPLWSPRGGYEWLSGSPTPLFFGRKRPSESTTIAIDASGQAAQGYRLFTKVDGAWASRDTWLFPLGQEVPVVGWSGSSGTMRVVSIDGKDYYAVYGNEHMCEIRLDRGPAGTTFLSAIHAQEIVGGYKGGTIDETTGTPTIEMRTWLRAFDVSGDRIARVDNFRIRNEQRNFAVYKLYCEDLNGDGLQDIMISRLGRLATPIVYINDGAGNFDYVDPSNFSVTDGFAGRAHLYEDLDGDGVRDLIYYPTDGLIGTAVGPVVYEIRKGNRHIGSGDLMK
jgi:hypothetical protein